MRMNTGVRLQRSGRQNWLASVLLIAATPLFAAGTVGSGSPASCTEAALNTALVGGGSVLFNCGAAPVSIFLTSSKNIAADTTIDGGNRVTLDGNGGGFYLFQVSDGRALSVHQIVLRNAGGAITASGSGTIEVMNSTIADHNGVFAGAAIVGAGPITIGYSTIKRNTWVSGSPGAGVASLAAGTLLLFDSEISGNIQNSGGGAGVYIGSNNAFISNCTFSGNSASGSSGAALRNDGSGTQIINSTFTGNDSIVSAIESLAGSLSIEYSTIAGNSNTTGISNQQAGVILTLRNSIVANNAFNCNGNIADGGHNLQFGGGIASSCGGSIAVANPLLDILADNGGATRTMALLPGSAAIDAGNPLAWCPSVDQRGQSRPFGAACDSGAYEWRPAAVFQNGFE